MKALSIKQPWASLIASGIKDIENRTWKINFRGRIFIHASAKWVAGKYYDEIYTEEQYSNIRENIGFVFPYLEPKLPDKQLPVSAIIGEVDIVDCVINHPSIWAQKTDFSKPDPRSIWNWVLANPVIYDEPILNVKGKLSFWDYER